MGKSTISTGPCSSSQNCKRLPEAICSFFMGLSNKKHRGGKTFYGARRLYPVTQWRAGHWAGNLLVFITRCRGFPVNCPILQRINSLILPPIFSGWWFQPTPLKNMSSSVGMMKFPVYGKIIQMFQTTKQFWYFFWKSGSDTGPPRRRAPVISWFTIQHL